MSVARIDADAAHAARVHDVARRQATGTPVVGYVCSYFPAEVVHALEAIPWRLAEGGRYEDELAGSARIRADGCSFCRSLIGAVRSLPFIPDVLVAGSVCDQVRRAVEVLARDQDRPVIAFNVPRTTQDQSVRDFFAAELAAVVHELEHRFGHRLDHTRLAASIAACNRARRKLGELDARRASAHPDLRGGEFLDWARLALVLDPEDFLARVLDRAAGSAQATKPPETGRGPRLMVIGSIIASGDDLLARIIEEELGGQIVADYVCTGQRTAEPIVDETGDPWTALVDAYWQRPPCIGRRPNQAAVDRIRDLVRARAVQGVVLATLPFCDLWRGEAHRLSGALGVPLLHVTRDYAPAGAEVVRGRLEAFFEELA